jgi:hypothetical protein
LPADQPVARKCGLLERDTRSHGSQELIWSKSGVFTQGAKDRYLAG